jgi:hypothetical protein
MMIHVFLLSANSRTFALTFLTEFAAPGPHFVATTPNSGKHVLRCPCVSAPSLVLRLHGD